MDAKLADQIYECAFIPERWPDVISELARIANARTGSLHISSGGVHRALSSNEAMFKDVRPLVESGWIARSARVERFFAMRHPGFLREVDVFEGEELEAYFKNDPTCREILIPRGLGRIAATTLDLPTADRAFISFEREWFKGVVEDEAIRELDALRPHIARSALMSTLLQLQQARIVGATLDALGLPALVLDDRGKVLAANQSAEECASLIFWRAHDHVALKDGAADSLLRAAVASISLSSVSVRSFPVRESNGVASTVAHIVPIRLAAQDIFSRCVAALVLTPVTAPGAPPVELVQSLFDLTPAEARVARGVAAGKTLEDIAGDNGVAATTVRTQMRGVFEKTGCSRQAEVAALLIGVSAVRLGGSDQNR